MSMTVLLMRWWQVTVQMKSSPLVNLLLTDSTALTHLWKSHELAILIIIKRCTAVWLQLLHKKCGMTLKTQIPRILTTTKKNPVPGHIYLPCHKNIYTSMCIHMCMYTYIHTHTHILNGLIISGTPELQ